MAPRRFTPYEKEMMISGHPGLSTVEIAAKYNTSRQYVYQLQKGLRGVKGARSEGQVHGRGFKGLRTASEHKFYAWACGESIKLLRDIIKTEEHLRKNGVFHSEVVKAKREAERNKERKWRHAEGAVSKEAEQVPASRGVVHQREPAYVPQARPRANGQNVEGFLFDSRRVG